MIPQAHFYPWAFSLATRQALLQRASQAAARVATAPLPAPDVFEASRFDPVRRDAVAGMAAAHACVAPLQHAGRVLLGPASSRAPVTGGVTLATVGWVPYAVLVGANAVGTQMGVTPARWCTAAAAILVALPLEMTRDAVELLCLGALALAALGGAAVGLARSVWPRSGSTADQLSSTLDYDDTHPNATGSLSDHGVGVTFSTKQWWYHLNTPQGHQMALVGEPENYSSMAWAHGMGEARDQVRALMESGVSPSNSLTEGFELTRTALEQYRAAQGGMAVTGMLMDKKYVYVLRQPGGPAAVLVHKNGNTLRCEDSVCRKIAASRVAYVVLLQSEAAAALPNEIIAERLMRNGRHDDAGSLAGQLISLADARRGGNGSFEETLDVMVIDVREASRKYREPATEVNPPSYNAF